MFVIVSDEFCVQFVKMWSCSSCGKCRRVVNVFVFAFFISLAEAWQQNIPAKNSVRYGEYPCVVYYFFVIISRYKSRLMSVKSASVRFCWALRHFVFTRSPDLHQKWPVDGLHASPPPLIWQILTKRICYLCRCEQVRYYIEIQALAPHLQVCLNLRTTGGRSCCQSEQSERLSTLYILIIIFFKPHDVFISL